MDYKLKGKVAIVGGSSKGLGKASAVSLAKEGVNIVLCARNEVELEKTKKEIEALGVEVLALSVDMTKEEDNERIVNETIDRFGTVDILVNNSGGPSPGSFRDFSIEDFDDAYNSVFRYNIRMTKLCLPYMEQKGWGRIINVASISVKEPMPDLLLSNIFRTAVVSFAKSIRKELIGNGLTINHTCPGYFLTERVTQLMEKESKDTTISLQEVKQKKVAAFPHKRFMNPEEFGAMVAYLSSEQARSVTGTTIQIDGGVNSSVL